MSLKKLMREIVDAVDGAGREFKQGFAGAFRKRGGRHRADADAIRGLDRRGASQTPRHRAQRRPVSHAKDYSILADVSRGLDALGRTPRHSSQGYSLVRDLGGAVGQGVHEIPEDLLGEVKGLPKKFAEELVDQLFEKAIGQSSPSAYGEKPGDMRLLAPAAEADELRGLDQSGLESRFDLASGALDGAGVEVDPVPGSRFVSVDVDVPGE